MIANPPVPEEGVASGPSLGDGVDEAGVRAQLERILKSEGFKTSVRMSRFLRYVTETALEGRFEEIKETCIGVAAYDREPSYDPKTDTVVRSEARRLRQKLTQYYEVESKANSVIIALPKRGYVPSFNVLGGIMDMAGSETHIPAELPLHQANDFPPPAVGVPSAPSGRDWRRGLALPSVCVVLALIVVLLYVNRSHRSQTLVASRVLPLTSLTGQVFQPAVSRDGTNTAFIWNQGNGNYNVYITQVLGKPLRITTSDMDDLHPSWSPDGRSLAFLRVSPDGADVMIIPFPGGMERKAFSLKSPRPWGDDQLGARNDTGPAWSADGKRLFVSDTAPSGHGLGVFSHSTDGGLVEPLSFPDGEDRDLSPTPSPDGRWIAFVRFTSYDSSDIYLVPSAGGKARQLTSEHTDIQGLAWMPGSHQLLFSSNRTGSYALWTLNIDGGPPSPVATVGEAAIQPSVSQDGDVMIYADASFTSSIVKASLRKPGGLSQTLTLSSPNSQNNSAQFSPDGKKIVFASNRTGTWELWTASADGTNQTQLTEFNSSMVGSPRWSPDGKFIVFAARPDVHAGISIISAKGGKPRLLSSNEFEEKRPGWSPDGQWVFFTSDRGGKMGLWKLNLAGGEPTLVSDEPRFDVQPSRDGKIYFTLEKRGLWQMSSNGGSASTIPGLDQKRFGRLWTVTPKGIFFIDEDSNRRELRFYDFNSRQASPVGYLPTEPLIGYPSLSVSPLDGSVLFSGKENVRSNLMIFKKTAQAK